MAGQSSPTGFGGYGGYQGAWGQQSEQARSRRGPKGYARSDDRIREDICETLSQDQRIDVSEVSINVQSGRESESSGREFGQQRQAGAEAGSLSSQSAASTTAGRSTSGAAGKGKEEQDR